MPRRRMLDPGIWTNIQFARLTVLQRLLYIGLISIADDEGRLNGDPMYIKGLIFPHDNITLTAIAEAIKRVQEQNLIIPYEVQGSKYLVHPNWNKYQHIRADLFHSSKLPPPPDSNEPVTNPPLTRNEPVTLKQQQMRPEEIKPEQVCFRESLKLLLSVGINESKAKALAGYYQFNRVEKAVKTSRSARNPAGLVIRILEQPPP